MVLSYPWLVIINQRLITPSPKKSDLLNLMISFLLSTLLFPNILENMLFCSVL